LHAGFHSSPDALSIWPFSHPDRLGSSFAFAASYNRSCLRVDGYAYAIYICNAHHSLVMSSSSLQNTSRCDLMTLSRGKTIVVRGLFLLLFYLFYCTGSPVGVVLPVLTIVPIVLFLDVPLPHRVVSDSRLHSHACLHLGVSFCLFWFFRIILISIIFGVY
jgi:hypothetical protein